MLSKYKQRCEWYKGKELLEIIEKEKGKKRKMIEDELTLELSVYLHDNGVIPLSQVVFGQDRPDVLGLYSGSEVFPIEVKVIKYNEKDRVLVGFTQILEYTRTVGTNEGFYVIFCIGDFTLDIPNSVSVGSQHVSIMTIDLKKIPPSKRSSQVLKIEEKDLIGSPN